MINPESEIEEEEEPVANLSSPWKHDSTRPSCTSCHTPFTQLNRRHHCRLCGQIFCNECSKHRALIPPSSIVLLPERNAFTDAAAAQDQENMYYMHHPTMSEFSEDDPNRVLTYTSSATSNLLYGKGLEERTKLAREPLRVCSPCYDSLIHLQPELRMSNSNAMRYNTIDPAHWRRLWNSPLAFTLGHEVRKAAYTLNNLLPLPKRMGMVMDYNNNTMQPQSPMQPCLDRDKCVNLSPNLGNLDGVRIPARLLEMAKGVAVLTVMKCGMGLGAEFGTGLVVSRLPNGNWSAPCAIGTIGLSWGALIGAQISDHVFLLMTESAIDLFSNNEGSIQLGADVAVSVGPVGRSLEADVGLSSKAISPIYTYSLSKGLYAGVSFDGKVILTRKLVNEKFYGMNVHARDLLSGEVPTPPAAQPLYDALKRCHVYATRSSTQARLSSVQGFAQPGPDVCYSDDIQGFTYDDGSSIDDGSVSDLSSL